MRFDCFANTITRPCARRTVAAAAVVVLAILLPNRISWAEMSVHHFWEHYPKAAKKLEDVYSRIVIEAELRKGGDAVQHERYLSAGRSVRWDGIAGAAAIGSSGSVLQSSAVANPMKSFTVTREGPRGQHTLSNMAQYNDEMWYVRLVAVPLFASYCAYEQTVLEHLKEPGVKITAIEEGAVQKKHTVTVKWRNGPTADGLVFDDASFTFLPDDGWALAEFDLARYEAVDPKKRASLRGTVDYSAEKVQGVPIVKHVSYWSELPGIDRANVREWEVTRVQPQDVAASEFTLGAFGLKEPGAPINPRTRWLLVTVAAVALILAGLLARRSGRSTERVK